MAGKKPASSNDILRAIDSRFASLQQRILDVRDEIKSHLDNRLETVKEEIVDRLTPMEKAFDKDALALVDHERRIRAIEKRLTGR